MNEQERMQSLEDIAQQMGYKNLEEMVTNQGILDQEGKPIEPYGYPEKLSVELGNGKTLYLYKVGEALPVEAKEEVDRIKVAQEPPKAQKMPKEVPAPGFFARIGDFFMKLGGGRVESCKKYDEYTEQVKQVTEANRRVEMLQGQQSVRVSLDPSLRAQADFAILKSGTSVEVERQFEQIKKDYNYDAHVSGMAKASKDLRTPEEQKATEIWGKVSPEADKIRLHQKIHFINNVTTLNGTKAHINDAFWNTEQAKALPYNSDTNDLFRDLCFIVKPGGKPGFQEYEKAGNAINNLMTGAHPESRAQDISHLREVMKGAVGFLNDELQKDGIKDNTRTTDANSRMAVDMTADRLFMTAQAAAHLGQMICEAQVKQGLMDVEAAEMAMRADALRTYGIDVKQQVETMKGSSLSDCSIQKHLDAAKNSHAFQLGAGILRAAGPERAAEAEALAASVSQSRPDEAEMSQQVEAFTKDSAVRALKGMGDNVKDMEVMRTLSAVVVTDQLQNLAQKNALQNPERFNLDFARELVSNAKFIEATNGKNSQQIAQDTLAGRFQATALDQAIPESAKRGLEQQKEMEKQAEKEMVMKAAAPKAAPAMGPH